MRVGIAADHAGLALKAKLSALIEELGHETVDFGAYRPEPQDDYPDYVAPMGKALASGEIERGIAICGSGVGACVVANKFPGVRAGLITEAYSAQQGVEHDDMNVLCLGGRVTGEDLAWDLVKIFLDAVFTEHPRHVRRLEKIRALEKEIGAMNTNPLHGITELGQSIWLDYLHRNMLEDGELQQWITRDGIRGVTSNPTIFQKAMGDADAYGEAIDRLHGEGHTGREIYRRLSVEDVQRAADAFHPCHVQHQGRHGFVSLEVDPGLAHDTESTIAEARELWQMVGRSNLYVKVPATEAGLPAIRRLTAEGINVNVTLLFGLSRYRKVAEAYLEGLRERLRDGQPMNELSSVASFFLSRIDALVDPVLEAKSAENDLTARLAAELRGQVAIASARQAYQIYRELFTSEGFADLAEAGARPQRLVWASTGTKNPDYSDVKYVEALIGPDTVVTAPRETLDAFRDHGEPAARLEHDIDRARDVFEQLPVVGIDIDVVTRQLEEKGVETFAASFQKLLRTIEERLESVATRSTGSARARAGRG